MGVSVASLKALAMMAENLSSRDKIGKQGGFFDVFNPFLPNAPFLQPLKTSENQRFMTETCQYKVL